MGLIELFNDAILESVDDKDNFNEIGPNTHKYYLPNDYAIKIKRIFDEHHWDSKELTPKNDEHLPFCSVASSARLAFVDVSRRGDYEGVEFEEKMFNDFCTIAPTKMDIIIHKVCYECKCQEIVDGEKETLRVSYLNHKKSLLFKELNIKKGSVDIKTAYKKDGSVDYQYLSFSCKNLNINIDKTYSDLHFNLKQMICHLIAMANSKKGYHTLQYIIYIPKLEIINQSNEFMKIYSELIKEIDEIFKPESEIMLFAHRHAINVPRPLYKTVNDFRIISNFEEIYR